MKDIKGTSKVKNVWNETNTQEGSDSRLDVMEERWVNWKKIIEAIQNEVYRKKRLKKTEVACGMVSNVLNYVHPEYQKEREWKDRIIKIFEEERRKNGLIIFIWWTTIKIQVQ